MLLNKHSLTTSINKLFYSFILADILFVYTFIARLCLNFSVFFFVVTIGKGFDMRHKM